MLPVAVARSSSDSVAIRYVLPVLWMTSCFHTMGPIGGRTGTALYILARRLPLAESGQLWVGRPASSQAVLLLRRPRTRDVARATALQSTGGSSQRLRKQSAVSSCHYVVAVGELVFRSSPYGSQDSLVKSSQNKIQGYDNGIPYTIYNSFGHRQTRAMVMDASCLSGRHRSRP